MSLLLDKRRFDETLGNLAGQIAEAVPAGAVPALVGIRRRGEYLAQRLLQRLSDGGRRDVLIGALDITLYRDDLTTIGPSAVVRGTDIDFDVTDKWLVLVDDVIYTGRSVRSALDAVIDLGRPQAIRLAVLVDRGWRELPIQPDFVGLRTETRADNIVKVKVTEIDGADEVELV